MSIQVRYDKAGNPRYLIRVFINEDGSGKQVVKSKTWIPPAEMSEKAANKEARRQEILFTEEVKKGYANMDVRIPFVEVAELYITNSDLRPKTVTWYRYILTFLESKWGRTPIANITALMVERLYAEMRAHNAQIEQSVTANDLKRLLKEAGMSQVNVAQKAGLSTATVYAATKGDAIQIESARAIAQVLGMPMNRVGTIHTIEKPYSASTINGVHRLLRAVFRYATAKKVLAQNIMDDVRAPSTEDVEVRVLDEREARILYRAILEEKDIRRKVAFLILLYCGLRKGELCGLAWPNVLPEKKALRIVQQLQEQKGGLALVELKTKGSRRVVYYNDVLDDALKEYRAWWAQHALLYGDAWQGKDQLLMIRDNGAPLNPGTINYWLDELTKRCGLGHITVHSLRHLSATLLIEAGAGEKTVQKILGHRDVSTTLKFYADVFDGTRQKAVDDLGAYLEKA